MKICIVIPVYNEAKAIGALIEAIRRKNFDCIVIDDGSTDACGQIAQEKGAVVIVHTQRSGKGYSLIDGFQKALEGDYDAVMMMDGDGQHAPEDIEKFIQHSQFSRQSVISGNRMQEAKKMPFLRYVTNTFMSWLISLACRQYIPDTQCGFRCVGIDVLRNITLTCQSFEIETEILMKSSKRGFKIYSVPVETIYEDEESKINPFKDAFRFIRYFVKELFSK